MKKSLLLSIIMVVVLIASLTVATFAWFFNNQTVTIAQIDVSAKTADSLRIKDGWSANWAYSATLAAATSPEGGSYNPATLTGIIGENEDAATALIALEDVSSAASVLDFFKSMNAATTDLATGVPYINDDAALYASATANHVWFDEFWLMLDTKQTGVEVLLDPLSSIKAKTATGVDAALLGAIRLAVFEVVGEDLEDGDAYVAADSTVDMELVFVWAPNADYATDGNGTSTLAATANENIQASGIDAKFFSTTGNALGAQEISLGEFENGIQRHFVACIWIEGTDAEAINANAGLGFLINLKFSHNATTGDDDDDTTYDFTFDTTGVSSWVNDNASMFIALNDVADADALLAAIGGLGLTDNYKFYETDEMGAEITSATDISTFDVIYVKKV